jgi:hypothetical protein
VINRCPDRGDVFRVRASCNEAAVALKAMKLLDCSPLVDYKIMTAVDCRKHTEAISKCLLHEVIIREFLTCT